MEALVNVILFFVFCLGLFLFFFKKVRNMGAFLIVLSLAFLFAFPTITFWWYKKESVGIYSDKKGTEILIDSKGKYKILYNEIQISDGTVKYSNSDIYSFTLDNNSHLVSINVGEITEFDNRDVIFNKTD